jgi:hypothetical protein
LVHTYDQEKWWKIEEDCFVAENLSLSPLLKPYALLDASTQDQHSLETLRNPIPLSYNSGGEESVSEELVLHSLLAASDKDAMNRGQRHFMNMKRTRSQLLRSKFQLLFLTPHVFILNPLTYCSIRVI